VSKKKSFWPYGITLAILAVVVMGAGTIMVALKHPVQMDEAYMKKYQNVDNHINSLLKSQELFDKQYKIIINTNSFVIGKNSLDLDVVDRHTNRHADNISLKIKITRPDDDRYDIKPIAKDSSNGFKISDFDIDKRGRWDLIIEASNGKVEGYYKKEIDTK